MKIEVTNEKPACWGCFHYSSPFSDTCGSDRSGYCGYIKNTGGSGEFWVEADHYCKRFTLINPAMPSSLMDALVACEESMDDRTSDDHYSNDTVAEMLAEKWDTAEEAIRIHFNNNPILDYRMEIRADWRTVRGAGWDSYYGPTPDEHYGDIAVTVYDPNNTWVFDMNGSDEDVAGGEAVRFLLNEFFGASV